MNKHDILNTLATVDLYSQLSCLGSMQYVCTAEAINRAIKLMPDTSAGVDAFLNEERNLKLDLQYVGPDEHGELVQATHVHDVETTPGNYYEQRRELMALLDLRQVFLDLSETLSDGLERKDDQDRSLLSTMNFMMSTHKVEPVRYARQYILNKRLGIKNYGQTQAEYVQQECARAAEQHERFAAKGEIAVQYLEGLDLIEGPIPERTMETLAKRCIAKLIARRIKIGQSLSWRTDPVQREEAEADILFIEEAIQALGGEVPAEAIVPEELEPQVVAAPTVDPDYIAFMKFKEQQTRNIGGRPYAQTTREPGPVTISH